MIKHERRMIGSLTAALLAPSLSWALTNGPSLPEYTSFEPVDATDLVHLSSGGFQYVLPVLTVPGPELSYPIALNYHSGIQAGEEASWVGLGWNLQAGAISRQVNKLPDDYRGSAIFDHLKSSDIITGNSIDFTFMGVLSFGFSGDSHNGTGGMVGLKIPLTNFGVKAGWNGVYEGYSLTYSLQSENPGTPMAGVGISYRNGEFSLFGSGGWQGMEVASLGISLKSSGVTGGTAGFLGFHSTETSGNLVTDHRKNGFNTFIIDMRMRKHNSWIEGYHINDYYGFIYSDVDGMGCRSNPNNCSNNDPASSASTFNMKIQEVQESTDPFHGTVDQSQARLHVTTQDSYMTNSQGLMGTFKPYRKEDGDYLNTLKNTSKYTWDWFSSGREYVNRTATLENNRNAHFKDYIGKEDIYWRFSGDEAAANRSEIGIAGRDVGEARSVASKKIFPQFEVDPGTGQYTTLKGFTIIKEDGTVYQFMKPLHVLAERTGTVFKDRVLGNDEDFDGQQTKLGKYAYTWLLTAILSPDYVNFTNPGHVPSGRGGWVSFTYQDLPQPYDWMAPYVNKNTHTDFVNNRDYAPNGFSQAIQIDGVNYQTGRSKFEGRKEIAYLRYIETPSHVAEFFMSDRQDGLGAAKPMLHRMGRQVVSGGYNKTPAPVYRQNLIIPREWSGIRDGDVIRTTFISANLYEGGFKEYNGIYDWAVYPCDKSAWSQTEKMGGRKLVDWGDLCAVVPSSWRNTNVSGYVNEMRLTYTNSGSPALRRLDKIVLRSRVLDAPVSNVTFSYDYSLSPGTPNSNASGNGKLTLTQVQFGAGDGGPRLPPHRFNYYNPTQQFQSGPFAAYEKFHVDRWGFVSPSATDANHPTDPEAVKAWNLNRITLPTGSRMDIEYESNRIKYVNLSEYFRPGSDGFRRVYWHQDDQYSPTKVVTGNPLIGPAAYRIRGVEIEFREMDDVTWRNLEPEVQILVSGTLQTMKMVKRTDGAQFLLTWMWPSAGNYTPDMVKRLRLLGAKDKKWMRASLIIDPPADLSIAGGGVRVKSVTTYEPIKQRSVKLNYSYFDGTVDALPASRSDFNDSWIPDGYGLELYQGTGNDIIYSKVRVEPDGSHGHTEFSFFTPRDFGIYANLDGKIGADAGGKDLYRVRVDNYSSMWGMMYKVQDFKETDPVNPVQEKGFKWIIPMSSLNNSAHLQTGFPLKAGKIDVFDYLGLDIDNSNSHFSFGSHQTVSSGRYFYKGCYVSNNCESNPPVATTQVVVNRVIPHIYESWSKTDGVKTVTQSYRYDLLTGRPLNTRTENFTPNGQSEWHITATLPAYAKYAGMLKAHQLIQDASVVKYHYPPGQSPPTYSDPFGTVHPISGDADDRAVSATETRWRPYDQDGLHYSRRGGAIDGNQYSWRRYETISWLSRPTPAEISTYYPTGDECHETTNTSGAGIIACSEGDYYRWISSGQSWRFDKHGTEIESRASDGTYYSKSTGWYGPTEAMVTNARSDQIFQESFEDPNYWYSKVSSNLDGPLVQVRNDSKTGRRSVHIRNDGATGQNKICFYGPTIDAGRGQVASVWFYDAENAATSSNPIRPGISVGTSGSCYAESFPTNLATGSKKWVRFEAVIPPGQCQSGASTGSAICLYSSRGQAGANVRYDELRSHPTDAFMGSYAYNETGNMISTADARETVTWFDYDRFGQLSGIRNDDGVLLGSQAKQSGSR